MYQSFKRLVIHTYQFLIVVNRETFGRLTDCCVNILGTMNDKTHGRCCRKKRGFATTAIHAGQEPERWRCAAVVTPIFTSTTFKWFSTQEHSGYFYTRACNPTRNVLEECLAALEHAKYAVTYSSGMGASSVIVNQLLCAGDHLLASADLYGGTQRLFDEIVVKNNIEVTYADFTCTAHVLQALRHNTRMIWLESPTNPLLKVIDIRAVVEAVRCRAVRIIIVVDNTFATPYFQRPLELGADITMVSLTKYMNGHSDVLMGSASTNNDAIAEKLLKGQSSMGIVPSQFDCYLVNRSLKTLALRMERHRSNAIAIALWIARHPNVTDVYHPELPSHPQCEIFKKQATGHSGVFSFRHNRGLQETEILLTSLTVFTLAESLGGYESLVGLPWKMSHGSVPEEKKQQLGITQNLIRLSVGLEDPEDLIRDLEQALDKAFPEYCQAVTQTACSVENTHLKHKDLKSSVESSEASRLNQNYFDIYKTDMTTVSS